MRYLVIDTETTGLDPLRERVIDFAAVPINGITASLETYQQYFNPNQSVNPKSFQIHGLSNDFLSKFPTFASKAHEIYHLLQDTTIIAHNASFDINFLNAEFVRAGLLPITNPVIDTLTMARERYPGKRVGLDALCKRFNICTMEREQNGHGALLDAKLLSRVYLKMLTDNVQWLYNDTQASKAEVFTTSIQLTLSAQEQSEYDTFLQKLK